MRVFFDAQIKMFLVVILVSGSLHPDTLEASFYVFIIEKNYYTQTTYNYTVLQLYSSL